MSGYSVKVPEKNIVQLATITNTLRSILQVKQRYFPIMEFLEFVLPCLDPDFSLEILSADEMGNNHGLTYPDQNIICLRDDIYEGAIAGNGRDRMTAAHELGHNFLHKNIPLFAKNMEDNRVIRDQEDSEWQANTFAEKLLVPASRDELIHLSTKEIALVYGVSLDDAKKIQYNHAKVYLK